MQDNIIYKIAKNTGLKHKEIILMPVAHISVCICIRPTLAGITMIEPGEKTEINVTIF